VQADILEPAVFSRDNPRAAEILERLAFLRAGDDVRLDALNSLHDFDCSVAEMDCARLIRFAVREPDDSASAVEMDPLCRRDFA
jgi:hypothetical protein